MTEYLPPHISRCMSTLANRLIVYNCLIFGLYPPVCTNVTACYPGLLSWGSKEIRIHCLLSQCHQKCSAFAFFIIAPAWNWNINFLGSIYYFSYRENQVRRYVINNIYIYWDPSIDTNQEVNVIVVFTCISKFMIQVLVLV